MLINQQTFDIMAQLQLRRVGDFYICSEFNRNLVRPPLVRIGHNIYHRFMNFIYLPVPTEKLSPEQVIEVCDLRLDYLDSLVDIKLNSRIASAMAKYITSVFTDIASPIKVLDFGCGSGLSSKLLLKYIPNLEIVGIDISQKAISHCRKQGFNAVLTHLGEPLPFELTAFDLIFAIFVLHFNIDGSTLAELRRVLRTSGKFVFNVYPRDIDRVAQQVKEAQFSSIEVQKHLSRLGAEYMIVSCGVHPPQGADLSRRLKRRLV